MVILESQKVERVSVRHSRTKSHHIKIIIPKFRYPVLFIQNAHRWLVPCKLRSSTHTSGFPSHTLTSAHNSSILKMRAVMYSHWIAGALEECALCTQAGNVVQPDGSCWMSDGKQVHTYGQCHIKNVDKRWVYVLSLMLLSTCTVLIGQMPVFKREYTMIHVFTWIMHTKYKTHQNCSMHSLWM